MKNIIHIALIMLFSFLSCGCVKTVNVEPQNKQQITVNCILNRGDTQTLSLTYSGALSMSIYNEVEKEKVKKIALFEDDIEIGNFVKKGYAEWELKYTPSPNKHYRLTIEINEHPNITAETIFPAREGSINHYYEYNKTTGEPILIDTQYEKYFKISGKRKQILWVCELSSNDSDLHTFFSSDDIIVNNSYSLFGDISSDYPRIDDFNLSEVSDERAKNIHFYYLRFLSDTLNTNNKFYISGIPYGIIEFRYVSEEYDKYLKSSLSKMIVYTTDEDDPEQWIDETQIYSNIVNGLGIFGAYNDIKLYCNSDVHQRADYFIN